LGKEREKRKPAMRIFQSKKAAIACGSRLNSL